MSYPIAELNAQLSVLAQKFERAQFVTVLPRLRRDGTWGVYGSVHVHGGKHYDLDLQRLRDDFEGTLAYFKRQYNLKTSGLGDWDIAQTICEVMRSLAALNMCATWCIHPGERRESRQELDDRLTHPLLAEGLRVLQGLLPNVNAIHQYASRITSKGGEHRVRYWASFRGIDQEWVSIEGLMARQVLCALVGPGNAQHRDVNSAIATEWAGQLGITTDELASVLHWTLLMIRDADAFHIALRPGR